MSIIPSVGSMTKYSATGNLKETSFLFRPVSATQAKKTTFQVSIAHVRDSRDCWHATGANALQSGYAVGRAKM